jgi:hypothetical protein
MFFNWTIGPAVFIKDIKTVENVKKEIVSEGFVIAQIVIDKKHPMFNIKGVHYEDVEAIITTIQYIKNYE